MRPAEWNINPIDAYEQKEFLDVFYQCLSEVPVRLADAFGYREIDGLNTEEICKKIPENLFLNTSSFLISVTKTDSK
jgi:DNA-directed RNA polymerase specialized sigma24 family protein